MTKYCQIVTLWVTSFVPTPERRNEGIHEQQEH